MDRRATVLCLLLLSSARAAAQADGRDGSTPPLIIHALLDDQPITPATVRFMRRTLDEAIDADAEALVLELNTPGGVLQSTQEFVTDILGSRVPVIVYVSPSGGRASSAGVFITLAGHVAAMAPGTRIGAAHPVQVGGLPFSPPRSPSGVDDSTESHDANLSAMEQKLINDTVAWARSLAEMRGRNADWAAEAVSKSSVLMASEALQRGVVDLQATDLRDLLQQVNGREVSMGPGVRNRQLRTADATVREIEPWWGERLLVVISNPNVALLLMLFGVYGILFELYSPGWGVSGTLGVVSLVLGFFGLSVLPVNYAGLALILIALLLFVAEAFVTSYGALALGGVVCLVLGGTMLVDSPSGFLHVSLEVLVPIAVSTALVTVFLVSRVVKAQRSLVQTGAEAMVGEEAIAEDEFTEEQADFVGQVRMRGEYWRALSPTHITKGQHVQIAGRDGLTLYVASIGKADGQPSTARAQAESHPTCEGGQS